MVIIYDAINDLFFGKISEDGYAVINESAYTYTESSQPEEPELPPVTPEQPEEPEVNVDEYVAPLTE